MNLSKMNLNLLFITFLIFIQNNVFSHRIKARNRVKEHIDFENHDKEVDHEMFLGKAENENFDKLPVEESKSRLKRLIENKVDINKDGFVSRKELNDWITHKVTESRNSDIDNTFQMYTKGEKDYIDYKEYFESTYGGHKENELDEESRKNLKLMTEQDDRKWKKADENGDNRLNKEEFTLFLHPERFPKMKSLVVDEALEISDKDGDGAFNVDEYLNDLWPSTESVKPSEEWITKEKESFHNHRDFDHNGRLDRYEIGEWLMPTDYDPIRAETNHLMAEADKNEDDQLSMEEIMDSHDFFAGSQATDYGKSLRHVEL